MLKKRFGFLDIAKAIGIFLVVWGHANPPYGVVKLIYAFHMPLFFFVSGYLFTFSKYSSLGGFLKTKAQHLLIPYLSLNLISYLFWLLISRNFGIDNAANVPVYKPLIGMLYGNGIEDFLHHCVPLWFLTCLFIVEALFYVSFKNAKYQFLLLTLFGLLGYLDHHFNIVRLPWGINIAFTAIIFYGIGHLTKDLLSQLLATNKLLLMLFSGVLLAIMGIIAMKNGVPDMNARVYNNYAFFIIGAFCGTFALIIISRLLEIAFKNISAFEFISMNTIVILGFHKILGEVIKGILLFTFKIPTTTYLSSFKYSLIFTVAEIALLIPVILFINAYCPIIIGRQKPNPSQPIKTKFA